MRRTARAVYPCGESRVKGERGGWCRKLNEQGKPVVKCAKETPIRAADHGVLAQAIPRPHPRAAPLRRGQPCLNGCRAFTPSSLRNARLRPGGVFWRLNPGLPSVALGYASVAPAALKKVSAFAALRRLGRVLCSGRVSYKDSSREPPSVKPAGTLCLEISAQPCLMDTLHEPDRSPYTRR